MTMTNDIYHLTTTMRDALRDQSALLSAVLNEGKFAENSSVNPTLSKVMDHFLNAPQGDPSELRMKKLMTAATLMAQDKGVLPKGMEVQKMEQIVTAVDDGLSRVKLAFQQNVGSLVEDMADQLIDRAAARAVTLVDRAFQTGAAQHVITNGIVAVGTFLGMPQVAAARPYIHTAVTLASSNIRTGVTAGIRTVAQTAKSVVREVINKTPTILQTVRSTAGRILSRIFS